MKCKYYIVKIYRRLNLSVQNIDNEETKNVSSILGDGKHLLYKGPDIIFRRKTHVIQMFYTQFFLFVKEAAFFYSNIWTFKKSASIEKYRIMASLKIQIDDNSKRNVVDHTDGHKQIEGAINISWTQLFAMCILMEVIRKCILCLVAFGLGFTVAYLTIGGKTSLIVLWFFNSVHIFFLIVCLIPNCTCLNLFSDIHFTSDAGSLTLSVCYIYFQFWFRLGSSDICLTS